MFFFPIASCPNNQFSTAYQTPGKHCFQALDGARSRVTAEFSARVLDSSPTQALYRRRTTGFPLDAHVVVEHALRASFTYRALLITRRDNYDAAAHSSMQVEQFTLSPATRLPRIWVGLWQLSSNAWGSAPAQRVRDAMTTHMEKGYIAFG